MLYVEYIKYFELLMSIVFFVIFFNVTRIIFTSKIPCFTPLNHIYSKLGASNLLWCGTFIFAIIDFFTIDNLSSYWTWIATTLDTLGSLYFLVFTIILTNSCMINSKTFYTLKVDKYNKCDKKYCLSRIIIIISYFIPFIIWMVTMYGIKFIEPISNDILGSKEALNMLLYETFYSAIGVSSLFISGFLFIKKLSKEKFDTNFNIGLSIIIFAISDMLQPIELYINNSFYLINTNLWWIEWILAIIGLLLYHININKFLNKNI